MAKRKRNQQTAPVSDQTTAPSPSKKPKIVSGISTIATSPKKQKSNTPSEVSREPKDDSAQAHSTPAVPATAESIAAKHSRKREAKRQKLREAKKNGPVEKSGDSKSQKQSIKKPSPQGQTIASVPDVPQAPSSQYGPESSEGRAGSSEQAIKQMTSEPAKTMPIETKAALKSALKRERKRKRLREAKKHASSDKPDGQKPTSQPEQKPLPKEQAIAPVPDLQQPLALQHDNDGTDAMASKSNKSSKTELSIKSLKATKDASAESKAKSKKQRKQNVAKAVVNERPNIPATQEPKEQKGTTDVKLSKKKARRQKLHKLKQANETHPVAQTSDNLDDRALGQTKSTSSTSGPSINQHSSPDTSLIHETTKTNLLPRPAKQWIEQDVLEDNHTLSTNDAPDHKITDSHILDPLAEALQDASKGPSPAFKQLSPAQMKSTPMPKNTPATSTNGIPDSFATVGVPSISESPAAVSTPLTRPGINTIASFSLSSRRHPASVLANKRTISGLSSMKMETGLIGSSPKPVSGFKANSVPSNSVGGDVKSAFERFNKFAHGGDSSDSDDSEESGSEEKGDARATKGAVTVGPVTHEANNVPAATSGPIDETKVTASSSNDKDREGSSSEDEDRDSNTTKAGAALAAKNQVDNTAPDSTPTKDEVSSSADSSESEDGTSAVTSDAASEARPAKTADTSTGMEDTASDADIAPPPTNAPRMLGANDLPLFSDFNAKHDIHATATDTRIERSASFLERELLGGNPSGLAQPSDDQSASANPFNIDYVASQDADELYKSIEDISREVFGSTREVPDCKPLLSSSSPNSLDVVPPVEPFVTDCVNSDYGLNLGMKSTGVFVGAEEKATALCCVDRGTSPVVYIVHHLDTDDNNILEDVNRHAGSLNGNDGAEQDVRSRLLSDHGHTDQHERNTSSSSLSTLTTSPTPPEERHHTINTGESSNENNAKDEHDSSPSKSISPFPATTVSKRKLTGTTSKHFSPRKALPRTSSKAAAPEEYTSMSPGIIEGEIAQAGPCNPPSDSDDIEDEAEQTVPLDNSSESSYEQKPAKKKKKKKSTGKASTFFTPTPSPSKPTRAPKGVSNCPVPSTNSLHFGLIQEKLWQEPFWLIIAVTFLNKTTGRAAAPIFWELKELYPTPHALSQAKEKDLVALIGSLGLQNQRAKRLILIANTWLQTPPAKNQRFRTLHYPSRNDGKDFKKVQIVEEDFSDSCAGALEIGHVPGCGPYAWDSWRIFCRDVLRGLARDYNGIGALVAEEADVGFEPEWMRVLPLDKELRACLRWMWLREGYVWDPVSGEKRDATLAEMEAGLRGEMVIGDEQERRFAREAAGSGSGSGPGGTGVGEVLKKDEDEDEDVDVKEDVDDEKDGLGEKSVAAPVGKAKKARKRRVSIARRELDVESGNEGAVSTLRRSRRTRAG